MEHTTLYEYCKQQDVEWIISEWHYDKNDCTPHDVSYGCNKIVWWKCKYGHEWKAKIGNRTILKRGCPFCSGHVVVSGKTDLRTWCISHHREDLIDEWDLEKNDISMDRISPKNSKKVWWRCSLGHQWDAIVSSRTSSSRPSGCPYCSKPPKRILVGFNDLESWCVMNGRDDLLGEWDYDNNDIKPNEVTFGSGKKVWWKCDKAHRWKACINNRTCGSKTRCPICTRTQSSFPEQAVAFYLSSAFNILQRYRINGYEVDVYLPDFKIAVEYDGRFFHDTEKKILRDKKKTDAITASGVRLIRLRETIDEFKAENTTIMFPASNGRYITAEFEMALSEMMRIIAQLSGTNFSIDIDMQRDEFQIRAHYLNTLKANSVGAVYPDLVPEWDIDKNQGVDAYAFSAGNNKKVWWKCSNGHSWCASIHSRTVRKLGCPFCAGQRTITGQNDLETWCKEYNPLLLAEWDHTHNSDTPSAYQKTSNKLVWWLCSKGHRWQASIANRVHGTNCPFCNTGRIEHRKQFSLYDWCIENDAEQLISEWNYERNEGKTLKDYSYGSHAKVWWRCSQGHEWQAVIKSRRYNHGCPYCSPTYKRAIVGVNDLATWCRKNSREDILEEWYTEKNSGLSPENVTKGSHKRVWWRCALGHEWEADIKSRTQVHGNTCPYCKKLN